MGRKVALLVSGASGMILPATFISVASRLDEVESLEVVVSRSAYQVIATELGGGGTEALLRYGYTNSLSRKKITFYKDSNLKAPLSSGSYRLDATVILPCSAATLGTIVTGGGYNLVHRAAAVALKERWKLIVCFRETPMSLIHLNNLRSLASLGAVIIPPIPAFYVGEKLEDFVLAYILRILDHIGISAENLDRFRWKNG